MGPDAQNGRLHKSRQITARRNVVGDDTIIFENENVRRAGPKSRNRRVDMRKPISSNPRRSRSRVDGARWAIYCTAGLATSLVGPLNQTGHGADVTYVEVNSQIVDPIAGDIYYGSFGPYTFGAQGASFSLFHLYSFRASGSGLLWLYGRGNISFIGFSSDYAYPYKLNYGDLIGASQQFGVPAGTFGWLALGTQNTPNFQFDDPGRGFLGFRFDVGNGTQYGFAELVTTGLPLNIAEFVGYGWGDPGEAIFAGQRPVIPEPGSLALLAMGAIGLLAWRRSRNFGNPLGT